ncbi:MAG: hypothetical protein A4E20_10815 [Nitrospira sp. SG-bin2]|uniref:capsid assembly scaffolding protein Gp46 family protein n=1 Tax=Nitrospira cf. moscoviensis SBR1015 TaxID=96242 RepID=UPI000A0D4337|nr:DUF4355 domain-containing protein [Nitrospira cf. moscoviensis SBR1015]OQW34503.1 MAG: hypothetical protein A4E20_10815 [Nitrospira sp. SG-bin2]
MSEDSVENAETADDSEDNSGPASKAWWQFPDKDAAVEWMNDKVQKRLAREKSKYDPIVSEHAILKKRVADLEPFEQAQKTDTQRWEDERNALKAELERLQSFEKKTQRDNLVREIAEDKGLPARFYSRIQGEDADTITADIEDFLNVYNDGKTTKPASRKPTETDEKPAQKGYGGGGSSSDTDDKAVVRNVVKKFRENQNNSFVR